MRVCEVYTSIQGEGPRTGQPTTFVRFGGCNLRCSGWGQSKLPDGTTIGGCDTVFAVYPEWRHTWKSVEPDQLLADVREWPKNVCITGGEPLTQRTSELQSFAFGLLTEGHTIDLFTNGSQVLSKHLWIAQSKVSAVVDYKLPGSGEYGSFDLDSLTWLRTYKDTIKFVCKDNDDVETALYDISEHRLGDYAKLSFGVVWDGNISLAELSHILVEEIPGASLNVQTHKYIWPPDERGR